MLSLTLKFTEEFFVLIESTKLLSVGKHLVDTKHLASMKMCVAFLIYPVSIFYRVKVNPANF